ncbi:MAG TPA: hypothetical protein DDW23_07350 [Planctomycetes bacterium]|nr:hypothetical protein [Planctomycetota bacterium]
MNETEKGRLVGDFEISRRLGAGGMGTVWEATQVSLGRKVALKILGGHISMREKAIDRFKREAEAGARIAHPAIVAVYQVGEMDGTHYIAQELVEGGKTLGDQILEDRKQTDSQKSYYLKVANLFAQVAEALQVAHDAGIIHRDIKPSNILLTPDNEPKISDFGLAHVEDELDLSRTGEFAGTPFYMSPEQAMARRIDIDHRTDIFSLGVTLWEALALQRPFDGDTSQQVLKKIVTEDPPDPRKLRSRCPRDLAIICMKALEKAPRRRFQTMAEFAGDLRRFLANETIHAKPPTAIQRTVKWTRRNPTKSISGGVAALALVAIAGFWQQAIAERNRALEAETQASAERDRAVAAKREATAAVGALQEMIAGLAPTDVSSTIEQTSKLLSDAEKIVRAEVQAPALRSRVLETLAGVALDRGNFVHALKLQEEVLEIFAQHSIASPSKVIATKGARAKVLLELGRFDAAKEVYATVLKESKKLHGEDSASVYGALDHLGIIEAELSNYPEAERLLALALEGRRSIFGDDDDVTLSTLGNLAGVLFSLGKTEEAISAFETVLAKKREQKGPAHPQTLSVMGNLGAAYATIGDLGSASDIFNEVVTGQEKTLGLDHPSTLHTRYNLSMLLFNSSRIREAEDLTRESLARLKGTLGDDYPLTLMTTSFLAGLLDTKGAAIEARGFHEEAIKGLTEKFGSSHRQTLEATVRFLQHLTENAEFNRALDIANSGIRGHIEQYGKEHPYTIENTRNARLLALQIAEEMELAGNYKQALQILNTSAKVFMEHYGNDDPDTIELTKAAKDLEPKGLNQRAWKLVDPDRLDRETDVIRGLELIQDAISWDKERGADRGEVDRLCSHGGSCPLDTLAWALYANGQYPEAIKAAQQALELAAKDQREECQDSLARLKAMIAETEQTLGADIPE